MTSKERIKLALSRAGKSQSDLAKWLDRDPGTVSEQLNKPGEMDSIRYLQGTAEITGFSFEWLRTGEGQERQSYLEDLDDPEKNLKKKMVAREEEIRLDIKEKQKGELSNEYLGGKGIRPVVVTVEKSGKELLTYVPVKAQAGYKKGYGDPQFLERLPAFSLPLNITGSGTYRMFQVDGQSMKQLGGGGLSDGDIVIARYVEDIFDLKDNRVYVVVSTEGVLVKRVLNRLKRESDPVLVLNSDNKNGDFPTIILHPKEILEVWELKAFISQQLSFNTDLYQVLGDLQAEQAIMREKIVSMEKFIGPASK
jgi:hypothetical protein